MVLDFSYFAYREKLLDPFVFGLGAYLISVPGLPAGPLGLSAIVTKRGGAQISQEARLAAADLLIDFQWELQASLRERKRERTDTPPSHPPQCMPAFAALAALWNVLAREALRKKSSEREIPRDYEGAVPLRRLLWPWPTCWRLP